MKNKIKPIDKSKSSNKRCINCEARSKAKPLQITHWDDKGFFCEMANKEIAYWNCCPMFRWNPDKLYKEADHED